MKVLDFDVLPKNVLNQPECRIFETSILKKERSYEANSLFVIRDSQSQPIDLVFLVGSGQACPISF